VKHAHRQRTLVSCAARLVATSVLAGVAGLTQASPRLHADSASIVIDGRGYGHGIGLSQYGAYGYAVDRGWTSAQILDHFYGGTVAATSDLATMTVRLTALDGGQTAVVHEQAELVVNGVEGGPWRSVVLRESASNSYAVWVRTEAVCPTAAESLTAGWTQQAVISGPVTVRTRSDTSASTAITDLLAVCEPSGKVRSYRGSIQAVNAADGADRTVNVVPVEQYLRSVVASEVPASWGTAGGGKGMQALRAQAVAARSYSIADARYPYAKTCDSQGCQVYAGVAWRTGIGGTPVIVEKPETDAAVASTAGVVRRYGSSSGAVAVTMFSSSSGGHTAPSPLGYTPVVDEGDGTTVNPSRSWSVTVPATTIQSAYPSIGTFTEIVVGSRDGYGEWGGRVVSATVRGTSGSILVTGDQLRSKLGLKSTLFVVRGAPSPDPECGPRQPPPLEAPSGPAAPAGFVPVTPVRIADSRNGLGVPPGLVGAGCTLVVSTGYPGATAASVNVTSVAARSNGFVTAYRCGQERPTTSVLQSVSSATVGGASIVPLDSQGRVCIYTHSVADLVVDLTGVFLPAGGARFTPVSPTRRFDSRSGAPLAAGSTTAVNIAGSVVPAGASAAALTVHALGAAGNGFATVYPCGTRPTVSSVNVGAGGNVANHVEVALNTSTQVCVYVSTAMHVAVDVSGWYGSSATARFVALPPARLADSRRGLNIPTRLAAGQNIAVNAEGLGGVPSEALGVVAQVVAVRPAAAGFLTVHPCLSVVPSVSMVRFATLTSVAVTVSGITTADGRWCLSTNTSTDVVIDVAGYFAE
jgi:SpoIID/LytB domain protein